MSDLNRVTFTGRLGQKPELRHTKKGMPVTNLSLASSRNYYDSNDEKQEETTWIRVAVWGGLAEAVAGHLDKGSRVAVDGRLQTHKFVSRTTKEEYSYLQVVADSITFLSTRKKDSAEASPELDDDFEEDVPMDDED